MAPPKCRKHSTSQPKSKSSPVMQGPRLADSAQQPHASPGPGVMSATLRSASLRYGPKVRKYQQPRHSSMEGFTLLRQWHHQPTDDLLRRDIMIYDDYAWSAARIPFHHRSINFNAVSFLVWLERGASVVVSLLLADMGWMGGFLINWLIAFSFSFWSFISFSFYLSRAVESVHVYYALYQNANRLLRNSWPGKSKDGIK